VDIDQPKADSGLVPVVAVPVVGFEAFERCDMLVFLIVLLVLWLILTIVGFAIKGLIWLAIVGIVLFLGTSAIGFVRRKASSR
jgi:hypothetical protein